MTLAGHSITTQACWSRSSIAHLNLNKKRLDLTLARIIAVLPYSLIFLKGPNSSSNEPITLIFISLEITSFVQALSIDDTNIMCIDCLFCLERNNCAFQLVKRRFINVLHTLCAQTNMCSSSVLLII